MDASTIQEEILQYDSICFEDFYQDFDGNVAAIDFGTTFCSLAYHVKGSKLESLKINETYDRVPNALLVVKKDQSLFEVVDIGFLAQTKYKNIPAAKYDQYLYFECFKMQLRDESKLSREMQISAFAGENYYIIEIIALMLQHLRTTFEKHLSLSPYEIKDGSDYRKMKATDFHWVLTVPAIWKSRGKQMMREAAYKAGLLAEVSPITSLTIPPAPINAPDIPSVIMDKLVLALEPECAALYCQQLTSDMVAGHCDRRDDVASNCYMVLDIGGGTVDIAIHDLETDTSINSVLPPTGNDWGGTTVNREFSVVFQKIVDDDGFDKFYSSPNNEAAHKAIITNLVYQDFEQPKKNFGEATAEEDECVFIRLDPRLVKFYENEIEAGAKQFGIDFDDDTLCIHYSKMEELFQPAVNGILSCMTLALADSPVSIDTIYLVGGFGGCPYIYRKIKDAVQRKYLSPISVVVPAHHKVAVAEGAVIFRQKMSVMKHRISDAHYGIRVIERYDPEKHEVARCVHNRDDERYEVHNVFSTFISKNQPVKFDDKFEKTLYPATHKQTDIVLAIYRTVIDGVTYVKDVDGEPISEIDQLGELVLPAPMCGLPLAKRNVEVEFWIGGTEFRVKAVYGPTGKEVNARLDFL